MSAEKDWIRRQIMRNAKGGDICVPADTMVPIQEETKRAVLKESHGFRDVAGMEELKQLVTEGFINVLRNRECARAYGITPPSLLFYGPAGCGKTFFAEKIAEEVGIHFMKIVPDDLASTYIHGTQEKIGEVFRKAERKAPTLIFFDEFDAMVPRRSNNEGNYQNGETNEFLCMLNNASEKGIYVIAATNYPERIDRAVLRSGRIDEMIYVDMPDFMAREHLFRMSLSKLPSADDIDFGRLAGLTVGYNCSDISYIIKCASRKMFNASIHEEGTPYKAITQEVLEDSIVSKTPSVSSHDLCEYERIRMEFSAKAAERQRNKIGFNYHSV